jgi:hypothetical protein
LPDTTSEPSMVRLLRAGGLTSSSIVVPSGITTAAPAAGTWPPGHAEPSDHLADGVGGGDPSPEGPAVSAEHARWRRR